MRTAVITLLIIGGMWLSACAAPSQEATVEDPGRATIVEPAEADCSSGSACSCGNGTVEANEECDPAASGWSDFCDDMCKRTVYEPCQQSQECFGKNSLCSAYEPGEEHLFCADICKQDEDCAHLPGFRATCNFAWCVVLCTDGECPNGMRCVPDQMLRNDKAEVRETQVGVCTAA